jgi:hypothetical protein
LICREEQQAKDEEDSRAAEIAAQVEKQAELEQQRQEEQRRQIQDALNEKTYGQFRAYAEQQYPNDPDRQGVLVRQLQEQHYCQYMQQVYQQQMQTQASQAIKEAASSQVNNLNNTATIDVEVSNGNQSQNSSQVTPQTEEVPSVNGISDLLSTANLCNTNNPDVIQEMYQSDDVESCHKAAAATFSEESKENDYNYFHEGNHEVDLDLDDDDDATDDDDNLDDDDDLDEESINHRVKPENHQCSEECGFCSEEDDSKYPPLITERLF